MVLRTITTTIPKFEELGLPPVLQDVAMTKRGLVMVVGGTGSGKSTVARGDDRLPQREQLRPHHHHRGPGGVRARAQELHRHPARGRRDTEAWEAALKNTLRQAPDVILIGEIRDREDHGARHRLRRDRPPVPGTLHANSANQALDRIINFFPEERATQLLMDLSLNMRALRRRSA